jgi:hypothetical protein
MADLEIRANDAEILSKRGWSLNEEPLFVRLASLFSPIKTGVW